MEAVQNILDKVNIGVAEDDPALLEEKFASVSALNFTKMSFSIRSNVLFPLYFVDISLFSPFVLSAFGDLGAVVQIQKDSWCTFLLPKDSLVEIHERLFTYLSDKEQVKQLKKEIGKQITSLKHTIDHLNGLLDISLDDAMHECVSYMEILYHFRSLASISQLADFSKEDLFTRFRKKLSKEISNKDFAILTSPDGLTKQSYAQMDLLALENPTLFDFKRWLNKWGYIDYYYVGPLPSVEMVRDKWKSLHNLESNPKKRLQELRNYQHSLSEKKYFLSRELELTKKDLDMLDMLSFITFYRFERKELMQESYVAFDKILLIIADACNLSLLDIKYLTFSEIEESLKGKDYAARIKRRKEYVFWITTKEGVCLGDDKESLARIEEIAKVKKRKQKASVAFSGEPVQGKLLVINSREDLQKIDTHEGDFILASHSTYPDLLPAMIKAKGIVTRVGGITSHASIVSRELSIPCIVGYSSLFDDFVEGDFVELDTEAASITLINENNLEERP